MKRFLSLFIVVLMIVSVFAIAGCDTETPETTAATTTQTTAPEATTTAGTTATTAPQTTAATTTASTAATTSATTAVTTSATTLPITTAETTTKPLISAGTTAPIFARFDFGTDTYAEANGMTSHEYLMSILKYNSAALSVEATEDSWVIYAKTNYSASDSVYTYALLFDDMVTYDFEDELKPGWGTWANYPYTLKDVGVTWSGRHQYAKVRMKNNSNNCMLSYDFNTSGQYYTTLTTSNMYVYNTNPDPNKQMITTGVSGYGTWNNVSLESLSYKEYIYDVCFCSGLASSRPAAIEGNSSVVTYAQWVAYCKVNGGPGGNNWTWGTGNLSSVVGMRMYFLGAYCPWADKAGACDSRSCIKRGQCVEIDYIVWGSTPEQLEAFHSNIESSSLAAK